MQAGYDGKISYTAADALNDALVKAGVECVFLNSGTDYPPVIESWAKCEAEGRKMPQVIISPHEYAALCAAQGYAQITGRAQAVFVHVDVGTQNLGGAVHNAFRCRVPVFIMAGLSPYTMEGELKGGRNAQIQFIQNISNQSGIVREYTKLNYEYQSGKNIQQMTYRALQIAHSDPRGPVYMTATREALEEPGVDIGADLSRWSAIAPSGLDAESLKILTRALADSKKPIIVTSYSGRNENCVGELVKLAERFAIPVIEANHSCMNFPGDNLLHLGFDSHGLIEEADLILVIDCDIPWIPSITGPKPDCRVFYLDADPLKEDIPLWYIKAERFMRADSYTALLQLNQEISHNLRILDNALIESRRGRAHTIHRQQREQWNCADKSERHITPEFLSACVKEVIDENTVLLNETITDRSTTDKLLTRTKPGTMFSSGGSSLGWHGGAAVGMKLACPDKDIVALTSDGTYIFSCPTAVYWMAARYKAPFMTVIYNNEGWNAPKMITKGEHPDGYAVKTGNYRTSFKPSAKLDLIAAAAGGAFAKTVTDPSELLQTLRDGKDAVKKGIPAVINVMLPPV